jgi:hypothetical protein
MKLSSVAAPTFLTFVSLASVASAKPKHPKPVTCISFTEMTMPVDGEPTKVAVCGDGNKPIILTTYQVVSFKDDAGVTVKGVIGFR